MTVVNIRYGSGLRFPQKVKFLKITPPPYPSFKNVSFFIVFAQSLITVTGQQLLLPFYCISVSPYVSMSIYLLMGSLQNKKSQMKFHSPSLYRLMAEMDASKYGKIKHKYLHGKLPHEVSENIWVFKTWVN